MADLSADRRRSSPTSSPLAELGGTGCAPAPTSFPVAAPVSSVGLEASTCTTAPSAGVLFVLLAAPWLAVMDGFLAIVAAPSIQTNLHLSDAGVQLVVAARVVAYAGMLITGGRLGDLHGPRQVLVTGLGLFAVSALAAAAAPTPTVLILARAFQGVSAALMYPQSLALIQRHWHGCHLTSAMAAFGVVLGLASGTALLGGGLVLQANVMGLGWRGVFLIDAPISAAAAVLAARVAPAVGPGRATGLDVVGAVLLTLGLMALVLPLTAGRELGWPLWAWMLLMCGGLVGVGFARHELRLEERGGSPLISIRALRIRVMMLGLVATLALYGGQLSLWLLLTLYLQDGLRLAPLVTGLAFVPVSLGLLVGSSCTPWLPAGQKRRVLIAGSLALAAGVAGLGLVVLVETAAGIVALLPALLVIGVGFGLTVPTLLGLVVRAVPKDYEGAASGLLVTAQQVAGALGIAATGMIFFGLRQRAIPYANALVAALGLNVGLFLVTAVLSRAVSEEA